MNINEQIRKFIDTNYQEFVPTFENIQFLHNYTGCNDYRLPEFLIKKPWDFINEMYQPLKTE